jgi:hypothetical protein
MDGVEERRSCDGDCCADVVLARASEVAFAFEALVYEQR